MELTRIFIIIGLAGLLLALMFSSGFRPWIQESSIPLNFQMADLVYECPVDGFAVVCGYNLDEQNEFVLYQLENGHVTNPEISQPHQIFAYCKQSESDDVLLRSGSYCLIDLQGNSIKILGYRLPGLENDFAFNDIGDQVRTCNPYDITGLGPPINAICSVSEKWNEYEKLSPDGYNNLRPELNNNSDLVFICEELFAFKWEPFRHLCTMELDGSGFREITQPELHVYEFSFNNNGQISFMCNEFDGIIKNDRSLDISSFDLCITDLSGQTLERIENPFARARGIVLNNHGDMAFLCIRTDSDSDDSFHFTICVVPAGGSVPMQLELDDQINVISLDLNDDGIIAFGCTINNSDRNNEVCIINLDGTGFQQLTSDDSMMKHPDLR